MTRLTESNFVKEQAKIIGEQQRRIDIQRRRINRKTRIIDMKRRRIREGDRLFKELHKLSLESLEFGKKWSRIWMVMSLLLFVWGIILGLSIGGAI